MTMTRKSLVDGRTCNTDECQMIVHTTMFGSDGYPVRRVGSRHWTWDVGEKGSPVLFSTKREAIASFEAFREIVTHSHSDHLCVGGGHFGYTFDHYATVEG
jgi:hypothetical protein